MGLGNTLAGRRFLQLDYHALATRPDDDTRPLLRVARGSYEPPLLGIHQSDGMSILFIWCPQHNHRTIERSAEHILETVTDVPCEEMAVALALAKRNTSGTPMLANYLFSALSGTTW